MAITIGDHWIQQNGAIGAISWRWEGYNIQQKSMAPMVTNGDSGANGTNGDPLETMTIHWTYNGDKICDNGTNGDNDVINGVIDTIGINEFNGTNGAPFDPMVPLAPLTPMAPMELHSIQWFHWRH